LGKIINGGNRMNKEDVLDKIIKIVRKRAKEYQSMVDKETINKDHYRRLLNELLNIIKEMESIDD